MKQPIIRAFCVRALEGEPLPDSVYKPKGPTTYHELCQYSNCGCPCNHPWHPQGMTGRPIQANFDEPAHAFPSNPQGHNPRRGGRKKR